MEQLDRADRPAVSHGEPFLADPETTTNLAACLIRAAQCSPSKGILYVRRDGSENFQPYPSLLGEAQKVLTGLKKLGLRPGDNVMFQLERNQDFVVLFWGCILGGLVPVPLSIASTYGDPNRAAKRLNDTWAMLGRPPIITSDALAVGIRSLSDWVAMDRLRLHTFENLETETHKAQGYPSRPEDLAILLLTSGSTGLPKAVMQSHRALIHQSAASAQMNGFTAEEVSLNWLPIDHVGGLVMFHFRDVFLGCQQIQVQSDFVLGDPLRWLDLIERYKATVTWAPNFAFGLINAAMADRRRRNWDLSSMRFIVNAGEAIVAKTTRRFLQLLVPHGLSETAMRPAWGMSETSSAVTYSERFMMNSTTDEDPFVEVGCPIPGVSARMVDEHDQVVAEGTIGFLQVKGVPVTKGYFGHLQLSAESFAADGWFRTGDRGFIRDGQVTITGRDKEVIIIHGVNYPSHLFEAAVEELDGVERSWTAACAVRVHDANTDQLAIFFRPMSWNDGDLTKLLRLIRQKVIEVAGINPQFLLPVEKAAIAKSSIGKIQRSLLRERFQHGDFQGIIDRVRNLTGSDSSSAVPSGAASETGGNRKAADVSRIATDVERRVAAIWEDVLGVPRVAGNDNFFELGGDSLSAMRIVARVVATFHWHLPVKTLFDCPTVFKMTQVLQQHQDLLAGPEKLEQLLSEVEAMSEEQVQQLLAKD